MSGISHQKLISCSITKFQFRPLEVVLGLLQPLHPVLGPHDNLWLLKMHSVRLLNQFGSPLFTRVKINAGFLDGFLEIFYDDFKSAIVFRAPGRPHVPF